MSVFLEDHLKSYNDLENIKSKITETVHTANFLTEQDKNVFKLDIGATRNPHEAMQLFLVTFGTTTFKRVFPRQ